MMKETRNSRRKVRHARVRARVIGSEKKPRAVVFRSNKHIYVQLVDDQKNRVIAAVSDRDIKPRKRGKEGVKIVAQLIAEKAKAHNIGTVVFDRGGYKYHGQIKVLADEMRAQGIAF